MSVLFLENEAATHVWWEYFTDTVPLCLQPVEIEVYRCDVTQDRQTRQ